MVVFTTRSELAKWVSKNRNVNKTIGFVPTMGALHLGHLSLVEKAKSENDFAVASIFVNPIQFNNKEDLVKYPRTIERDCTMLEDIGCDVVFIPEVAEMYPEGEVTEKYDFGSLEKVMEGAFRPGHFNGVAVVVKRLFKLVNPHRAYFGEKDYQQLQIIKALVKKEHLDVEIVSCGIVREADGLAMSSRNLRLSETERSIAPAIYRILNQAVGFKRKKSVGTLKNWVEAQINSIEQFKLEYFEIADSETLQSVENWIPSQNCIGCIAVWIGNIRLIDNVKL